jgi:hypothetical protein
MKINRYILPDEDPFLHPVRPLVENCFKIITWFGVTATFQIAATTTGNWYLWAVCGISYLLVFLYLQSLIDWIWKIRRDRPPDPTKPKVPVRPRPVIEKARTLLKRGVGLAIWLALCVIMQNVVGNAIAAIIEFQHRSSTHP